MSEQPTKPQLKIEPNQAIDIGARTESKTNIDLEEANQPPQRDTKTETASTEKQNSEHLPSTDKETISAQSELAAKIKGLTMFSVLLEKVGADRQDQFFQLAAPLLQGSADKKSEAIQNLAVWLEEQGIVGLDSDFNQQLRERLMKDLDLTLAQADELLETDYD